MYFVERPLREKCPYSEFFWSVFLRIRAEYGDIRRYVSLRIQSECGKIRTRKTPNRVTFHAAWSNHSKKKVQKALQNIF